MKKFLYMLFLIPVCILSMLSIVYLFSKKEPFFFLQNVKINGDQSVERQRGDGESITLLKRKPPQNRCREDEGYHL